MTAPVPPLVPEGPRMFKPSEVRIDGSFPPLVATFDRTENECAATLIVRGLAVKGDTWRPIEWTEMVAVIKADVAKVEENEDAAEPVQRLMRDLIGNPFCRPDAYGLVDRGYARWVGDPGKTLEFSDAGLARLAKWARIPAPEPGKPPATCASWCGGKTDGALVFCSDACFIAHANRARTPAAGTAPPLAFGMRTAREIAAEVWDSLKRGENVIDMYAAAIEQDRREMIAACREVAEEGVCSFGTDYSARCAHTACAVKRTIGRRIRSLVAASPQTPPGGTTP